MKKKTNLWSFHVLSLWRECRNIGMPTGVFLFALLFSFGAASQEIIPLYTGAIPNTKSSGVEEDKTLPANGMYRRVTEPTLELYLPEKDKYNGAAVIICPGGGYSVIVYNGEGITTAKALAKNGIAAFILKYRLPDDSISSDKKMAPLQDAQQAIKLVRENAGKWGLDKNKIGIMGFSAGGHLASTAATHFDKPYIKNRSHTSLRPNFQILVYPVISMQDSLTHADSRRKLLGNQPSKETIELFSNELQVTKSSPPAYITHAADDKVVHVNNSIIYFQRLQSQGVPVAMHIYPKGDHGFIFKNNKWMHPLLDWLEFYEWKKE